MGRTISSVLLALTLAATARAQGVTANVATYGPFGVDDLDGDLPSSVELRLSIPISKKQAVEPFATVWSFRKGPGGHFEGFYGAQIRHRIGPPRPDRNGYVFATYGAAGWYPLYGSDNGVFGLLGVGLHHRLAEHVSLRPEVQLVTFYVIPVGARFTIGLSMHRGEH
jgi:hypothetical protein